MDTCLKDAGNSSLKGISWLFILSIFLPLLHEFSLVFSRPIYKIQIPIDSQGEWTLIYSSVHLFSPPHGRGRFIWFSGYAADLQLSQQSSHTKLNKDIFLLLAYTRMLPVCLGGKACISSLRSREAKFIWTRTKFIHEDHLSCWIPLAALYCFRVCEIEPYTPVCIQERTGTCWINTSRWMCCLFHPLP